MATRNIQIIDGNARTGSLTLDYPRKQALAGDTIHWHIRTRRVHSIVRIEPKPEQINIWVTPPAQQGNHFKGDIKSDAPDDYDYNYTIVWKATKGGADLKHDPIIRIRPTGTTLPPEEYFFSQPIVRLVVAAVLLITGISFCIYQINKLKKK